MNKYLMKVHKVKTTIHAHIRDILKKFMKGAMRHLNVVLTVILYMDLTYHRLYVLEIKQIQYNN